MIHSSQHEPLRADIKTCAVILNLSLQQTYKKVKRGELKAHHDGDKLYVTTAELRRYVESCPAVEPSDGQPRAAVTK